MTPYQKYVLSWVLFFPAALLIFLFARVLPPYYGIFVFIGFFIVANLIMRKIDCPRCGTPIGYGRRFKGVPMSRSFSDTHCNECGFDLNQK